MRVEIGRSLLSVQMDGERGGGGVCLLAVRAWYVDGPAARAEAVDADWCRNCQNQDSSISCNQEETERITSFTFQLYISWTVVHRRTDTLKSEVKRTSWGNRGMISIVTPYYDDTMHSFTAYHASPCHTVSSIPPP